MGACPATTQGGSGTLRSMATPTGKQLLTISRDLFRQDRQMVVLPIVGGLASMLGALIVGGALEGIFHNQPASEI